MIVKTRPFIVSMLLFFSFSIFLTSFVHAQIPISKEAKDKTETATKKMKKGDFDSAIQLLKDAIKYSQYYPEAYINLCTCYYYQNNFDEAEKACNTAIKLNPSNNKAQPFFILGQIAFKKEKFEKAIEFLQKAVAFDKRNSKIHQILGLSYLRLNRNKEAIKSLKLATNYDTSSFQSFFFLANLQYKMGLFKDCQANYEKCLKLKPKYPVVYNKLATSYRSVKNYKKALSTYDRFLKIFPKNMFAYLNKGELYILAGNPKGALKSYGKAIKINPKNASPYIAIGNIYTIQKNYEKAIKNYNKGLNLNPHVENGYFSRGKVYFLMGKFHEAINDLTQTTLINPDSSKAFEYLVKAYEKIGNYQAAITNLDKLFQLSPENADAMYLKGKIQLHTGVFSGALESFQKAIKIKPNKPDFLNERGVAYFLLDKHDEAIKDWNTTLKIEKNNAVAMINLASAMLEKGKKSDAKQYLTKAQAIEPDSTALFNSWGEYYLEENSLDKAEKSFQSAIKSASSIAKYRPVCNLAILYIRKNQPSKAIDTLSTLDENSVSNLFSVNRLFGDAFFISKNYQKAMNYYEMALQTKENDSVIYNLALANLKLKNYKTALNGFQKLVDKGNDKPAILNNLAIAQFNLNKSSEAIKSLKKALQKQPDEKMLMMNLATTYYASDKKNEAIKLYQKLSKSKTGLTSKKTLSNAYFNQGNLFAGKKNFKRALTEYKKALQIDKSNPAILNNIGVAYIHLNQPEQALQNFTKGLKAAPDDDYCLINLGIFYEKKSEYHTAYSYYKKCMEKGTKFKTALSNWLTTYKRLFNYE